MAVAVVVTQSPPGAPRRPLEFIEWAVAQFGSPGPPGAGRVVIACSQKELTLAFPGVASQGTVAWYVSQLRQAGVVVGTRPLVVDVAALARARTGDAGSPAGPAGGGEDEAGGERAPEPVGGGGDGEMFDLLARQARQVAQVSELLAQLMATNAEILAALAAEGGGRDRGGRRLGGLAEVARCRETRDSVTDKEGSQEGFPGSRRVLPSFLREDVATRESRAAGSEGGAVLAPASVDELVAPLRDWCRRNNRSDRLDDRGRQVLGALGAEELRAGAAAVQREAAADARISRPLGLLVARARSRDLETFRVPPPPSPPPAVEAGEEHEPGDEAARAAVALLETDPARARELSALDRAVARVLAEEGMSEALRRRVLRSPGLLRAQRQRVWPTWDGEG